MSDMYQAEKQAEQIEAAQQTESQSLEGNITEAEPAQTKVNSESRVASESSALKTEVGDRQYAASQEADRRVRDAVASDRLDGTTNVELSRINPTDVKSPNDFNSPEQYAGMRREAEMLKQMQPTIEQGATVDTFDEWDRANQIGHYSPDQYVRGYVDVYHTYYDGSEPVALEPKGDGTYDVINGRHRIYAVHQAGLKTIPARIVG
jgi:hypothetical protein